MRRSRKRSQPAATGQGPQLSGALKIASQEEDGVEAAMVSSGGSPASGIAPPSDPLTEEAIFERTSESGWYTVDNDGFNRPVAYRRTPRFDDRTDRTAKPKMLFRSVEELPEWVQASNRLWLVRCPRPRSPQHAAFARIEAQSCSQRCPMCVPQPRCFVSVAEPPGAGSPGGQPAPLVESVTVPSIAGGTALDAPEVLLAGFDEAGGASISQREMLVLVLVLLLLPLRSG